MAEEDSVLVVDGRLSPGGGGGKGSDRRRCRRRWRGWRRGGKRGGDAVAGQAAEVGLARSRPAAGRG